MQQTNINLFQQWVEQSLKQHCGAATSPDNQHSLNNKGGLEYESESSEVILQALPGDAGHRRYYRVIMGDLTWMAVLYPQASQTEIDQFVDVAQFLRKRGVHTPAVVAADGGKGYLLLEDLGPCHLLDELNSETADGLYASAVVSLLCIQQIPDDELQSLTLPEYSRERFRMEMNLMLEWFIEGLLDHHVDQDVTRMLDRCFSLIEDSALEQPVVMVHRDYHSRNLLIRQAEGIGVIDFQDAVTGPVCYDPVSLFRDCYVAWPQDKVLQWSKGYKGMAQAAGILPDDISDTQFERWLDLMGLQRHIKVLGIFARLSIRDGKHQYLKDLPLVIQYVRDISSKYSELESFSLWFERDLLPLIQKQTWFVSKQGVNDGA